VEAIIENIKNRLFLTMKDEGGLAYNKIIMKTG